MFTMNKLCSVAVLKIMMVSALAFIPLVNAAGAEQITLRLSQEQDGGEAGRACMYIHQGKAEYRVVQANEVCPATLIVERASQPG